MPPLPGPGRGGQPCHTHEGSARHPALSTHNVPSLSCLATSLKCTLLHPRGTEPTRASPFSGSPLRSRSLSDGPAPSHPNKQQSNAGAFAALKLSVLSLLCTPGALLAHSHTHTRSRSQTPTHTHIHALAHSHTHTHKHLHSCSQTHSHAHTHTLSHTHTPFGLSRSPGVLVHRRSPPPSSSEE